MAFLFIFVIYYILLFIAYIMYKILLDDLRKAHFCAFVYINQEVHATCLLDIGSRSRREATAPLPTGSPTNCQASFPLHFFFNKVIYQLDATPGVFIALL